MTDRQLCPICHRPVWLSPPTYKDGPRGMSHHCRRHTPLKRYVIRYNPTGGYDDGPTWEIYDRQLCAIVEGGYTQRGAQDAAAFHNFKAYGPGPWRP